MSLECSQLVNTRESNHGSPGGLVTTKESNHEGLVNTMEQFQGYPGQLDSAKLQLQETHFPDTISGTKVLDQQVGGLPSYGDVMKKDKEETMPAARVFEQIKSWLASYREETLPTPGSVLDKMRMCGGFACSKNTLIGLNVVYIIASFLMIGVVSHEKTSGIVTSLPIVGGIIACGIFLLFISVVGLLGAVRHHREMLLYYVVFLFLIFLIQFSVSCSSLAINEEDQRKIVEQSWNVAYNNNNYSSLILLAEQHFSCCGLSGSRMIALQEWESYDCSTWTTSGYCYYWVRFQAVLCDHVSGCELWNDGTYSEYERYECPTCMDKIKDLVGTGFNRAGVVGLIVSFAELLGVLVAYRYTKQTNPSTLFETKSVINQK